MGVFYFTYYKGFTLHIAGHDPLFKYDIQLLKKNFQKNFDYFGDNVYCYNMNKLGIILAGVITCMLFIFVLPPIITYIIGCYQIGSWVGSFIYNKLNDN